MEIIVGLVAALVAVALVRGLTRRTPKPHFDGEFVSPSYRARLAHARASRSEFDANRMLASK